MEAFEDGLDDWFIESLKTYNDLYVYQLESPTRVADWTSGDTVCVAGYSSSKNEILELRLPPRLLADANKGLCAERDFKVVHGGLTDTPVHCLKHIPGTRYIVTNDGRSSDLQVWKLGEDSDVIQRAGGVAGRGPKGGSRMAARRSSDPQVLHGATSADVQLSQLVAGSLLFELDVASADPLSSLQFLSDSVFLAGCCNGSFYIADVRASSSPQVSPPPASSTESSLWWTEASAGPPASRILRVSSSGEMLVSDLRNLGEAVSAAQMDTGPARGSMDHVRVSWAPVLNGCIAVSGFGGAVEIYDTSCWTRELQKVPPVFVHCGHSVSSQPGDDVVVTSHLWHPHRPRTLLSTASDGSVHLWDWVDQSAAS
eukprot:XP_003977724.1 PREDICTED: WD repeat-containing protein 73 [Takifugu rubripes]